jgi:hypothetical protein
LKLLENFRGVFRGSVFVQNLSHENGWPIAVLDTSEIRRRRKPRRVRGGAGLPFGVAFMLCDEIDSLAV